MKLKLPGPTRAALWTAIKAPLVEGGGPGVRTPQAAPKNLVSGLTPKGVEVRPRDRPTPSKTLREDLIPGSDIHFALEEPFSLPWMPKFEPKEPKAKFLMPPERTNGKPAIGFGDAEDAKKIMDRQEASPAGYFAGRNYRLRDVGIYIGIANHLRVEASKGKVKWGKAGWEDPENGYEHRVADLNAWARICGVKIDEIPSLITAVNNREALWPGWRFTMDEAWAIFMSLRASGDMPKQEIRELPETPKWEEVESCALAMRFLSQEQMGLLLPMASLDTVEGCIQDWVWERRLAPHPGLSGTGQKLYRVTEGAVKDAVQRGLMDEMEGRSRLVIRSTQELHDMAVGDAIILAALEIESRQGEVLNVMTETTFSIRGEKGPWPDFQMDYRVGTSIHSVCVEVVGLGAGYRGKTKKAAESMAGFRVFRPGLDGLGARYS